MSAIVVGYVPTAEGRAALDTAVDEAQLRGVRLVVVNSHRGGPNVDPDQFEATEEQIEELAKGLDARGVDHEVRNLVRGNDPADDLIEIAGEYDADLIVIGLRKRSPVGKLIMGSNSQRILLEAPCAVLAVKAPPAT